jgi:DNA sulfur modification protein DndE
MRELVDTIYLNRSLDDNFLLKRYNNGLLTSVLGVLVFSLMFTTCLQTSNNVQAQAQPNSTSSRSAIEELNVKMAQISSSNKPEDIATLAYIWGFPLVSMERQFNFVTSVNTPPGVGRGPANSLSCATDLINASYTDVVSPNSDTLYCQTQFDLTKEPVIVVVPPITDRYYTFEFLDAYTNVFAYIGTRATGGTGGTYLIAGPEWNEQVPDGMTKIWSPTNLAWFINRILVKGPGDLPTVHSYQDKISVNPLSVFQAKGSAESSQSVKVDVNVNGSKEVPIGPQPALIAPTGIKIFDEIGAAMIGNPPNPPDPQLITKFAEIGIGPDKVPSQQANDTIKAALETGIREGQKLIDARVANAGTVVNGWLVNALAGAYGADYLFRAAITQLGLGANIAQEALYPATFTDNKGKPLNGNSSYLIHFEPGQTPPVDAFWSITMYDDKSLFVDNPINRYSIGKYTEGLKNNTDGSIDILIQHSSPGKDKESNWLPSSEGSFNMIMRTYLPQPSILNGTWSPPSVQKVG